MREEKNEYLINILNYIRSIFSLIINNKIIIIKLFFYRFRA